MQFSLRALRKLAKGWKESVDAVLIKNTEIDSKIKVMEAKYDFMCNLVMEDVKMRRGDLWEHHSPLKPTETARAMIPDDIMEALKGYNGNGESSCILKALYISETVTPERLASAAKIAGLSLLEFMTLVVDIEVGLNH